MQVGVERSVQMKREEVVSHPTRPGTEGGGEALVLTSRRAFLAGAGSIVGGLSAQGAPTALPNSPTILVAGPPGSRVAQWAALIAEPLGKSLLQTAAVARVNVGGADGVTGANHFQASIPPDGATAMIVPCETTLSWLVGDTRVRFDVGSWAPLWGGTVSAVAVSRVPLIRGRRLHVAVESLVGPDLAALLALDLMGIDATPVPVGPGAPTPLDRADVDVVLLRGAGLRQSAHELAARRWTHKFSLGVVGAEGRIGRDPAFSSVPTAFELVDRGIAERGGAGHTNELLSAFRSVAAAATLEIALVLPLLAPAAVVAWWRQGCTTLASVPEIQEEAARTFMRPVEAGHMAASMALITAEPAALLELRRWLAERHQWRPG